MRKGFQVTKVSLVLVFLLCLTLMHPSDAAAQSGSRLIARVYPAAAEAGPARVATFAGDGTGQVLYPIPPTLDYLRILISPDLGWLAAHGAAPGQQQQVFAYRRLNGNPIAVPVQAGVDTIFSRFSVDSRYLLYTTSSLQPRQYTIGVITLANGVRREFVGSYGPGAIFPNQQAAYPIHFDGRNLYVVAFVPNSDAGFGGFYRIDLSGYQNALTGRYPLPLATRIVGGGSAFEPLISPDGRQAAILYYDPSNPPQNYVQQGPGFTVNALAHIDLASGRVRTIAKAGPGQGLEQIGWRADNRSIILTGGNYSGGPRLVNPGLYTVDAATGQVQIVGTNLTQGTIDTFSICGDRIFYSERLDPNAPRTDFKTAPIGNLADSRVLIPNGTVEAISCTAQ